MGVESALVTGAGGFIGPHLVRELSQHGFQVTAATRSSGDVTDPEAMRRLVAGAAPTHVFHLAGVRDAHLDELLRVNVHGTANLLEAVAEEAPAAHVVVVGSAAGYGEATHEPVGEDQPLRPVTDYGVAKAAQELVATAAAARRGTDVTRIRLFNLVGPGEPTSFVVSAIAGRIVAIQSGSARPPLRTGDLETRRDFVDVRDAVRALRLAATRGERGAVYNVCSEVATRIGTVVEKLLALADLDVAVESVPEPAALNVRGYAGSSERLRAVTGWEPQRSLDDSLAEVFAARCAAAVSP